MFDFTWETGGYFISVIIGDGWIIWGYVRRTLDRLYHDFFGFFERG